MTKNEIRRFQKELRSKLSTEEHNVLSDSIRKLLLQSKDYQNCSRLFVYVSFRSEVNTLKIIEQSLADKKRVFAPKTTAEDMEFYEIHSFDKLNPSRFGVLEPVAEEGGRYIEGHEKEQGNLMLLPGLGFDLLGNRIGYGAGYYDRYLVKHPNANFNKIALSYDFQIMEQIPSEDFDIRVDAIITPSRMIRCIK